MNRDLAYALLTKATVNRTSAEMILSSVHVTAGDARRDVTRLDSIYGVFPKMVMGERNRHRGFSLSDRSSRAVPPEKLIEEIRSGVGLAMPAKFRKRAKGMGGGEDLTGDELMSAQLDWIEDALNAADGAERALMRGEEKETVNRRLDMYIYMHTLMTGVRDVWLNFFGLRLANASPTIELFAKCCFNAYAAAEPNRLSPGSWHFPFIDIHEVATTDILINLSAARCAHLSYNDLETGRRMTVERALGIAVKLKDTSPLHASPFEHQATPDVRLLDSFQNDHGWRSPSQHGNLPGWRQARKMIPGEAVAPLPAGYEL
jgi:hypothetical protein